MHPLGNTPPPWPAVFGWSAKRTVTMTVTVAVTVTLPSVVNKAGCMCVNVLTLFAGAGDHPLPQHGCAQLGAGGRAGGVPPQRDAQLHGCGPLLKAHHAARQGTVTMSLYFTVLYCMTVEMAVTVTLPGESSGDSDSSPCRPLVAGH